MIKQRICIVGDGLSGLMTAVILSKVLENSFSPEMVAGHSLGEFSALVSARYLSFEDGLKLVSQRAQAMQKACEKNPSTMAAVIGLENEVVEDISKKNEGKNL